MNALPLELRAPRAARLPATPQLALAPAAQREPHCFDACLRQATPTANALLKQIFGDSVMPRGEAIWLSDLIELMALFGVDPRATRTGVFRLTEQGCLTARRYGRRSAYAVLPDAAEQLRGAWHALSAPPDYAWDGSWTLLINTGGGGSAPAFAALRRSLAEQGYCALTPQVLARPTLPQRCAGDTLPIHALTRQGGVLQVAGQQVDGLGALSEMGRQAWNLSAAAAPYHAFLRRFAPLRQALADGQTLSARQAFALRMLVAETYRQCRASDPLLPSAFLPQDWPAMPAYELCLDLYLHTFPLARQHVEQTLGEPVPVPVPPSLRSERTLQRPPFRIHALAKA
ncbi:PaaX family transcriptional regulator C-terminal domain-containing protein [Rugamonas sp. CCM 8940]|uniref:PaaX family transcriptional regulator n=1 Tax=Rugamonas sp. CCM 8940 TaxID=2765359 RepID=UPI0018F30135|nr:PaaX family transcriptional regulator C-terminal domain-containing protein [Rugamonas sp. CCM 8940]MBJ7312232.1 hypothetical protein [Rugamonas sp. CCM 8940]